MTNVETLATEAEAYTERKITEALTPEVLAKLAAKGISEAQARELLRQRVARDIRAHFSR